MLESQYAQSHLSYNTVWQLMFNELSAEMVQIRCEVLIQQRIWFQKQQKLQHTNQILLETMLQLELKDNRTQAQLMQLKLDNQHDALTQTLNRHIMLDRINHAISIGKRQNHKFALLFIDLDNFKPVNDQYGHAAGDAVLQQVSKRLTAAIRDSDAISRHGGDEFLLLLNDIKCSQDVTTFALKLVNSLSQPYQIAENCISLSASVGIALFPEHIAKLRLKNSSEHNPEYSPEYNNTAKTLINYADTAMYQAKQQGGAQVC